MAGSAESVARSALEVCLPVHLPRFRPERRRHPRHGLPRHCWVESPQLTIFGPIHDIAAGGMFVRTAAQLAPGTRVDLTLQLGADAGELLRARATVARSDVRRAGSPSRGLGLEFVEIERGGALLRSLLDRAAPLT